MKKTKSRLIYVGKNEPKFYTMSAGDYAEFTQLSTVLVEATKLLLRKVQANPNTTLHEYATQHLKGQHVLLKAYSNFSKSPINRLAFISNFMKVFQVDEKGQRNGLDYLQLLRLVCSDFPRQIVISALRYILSYRRLSQLNYTSEDEYILNQQYSVSNFIKAIYICFMFGDFIKVLEKSDKMKIKDYYHNLKQFYEDSGCKQLQRPPFRITACVLLSLCRDQGSVEFLTEQTMENYLVSDNLNYTTVLKAFYDSSELSNEIEDIVEMQDNLSVKVGEIYRIATEKVDFGLDQKEKKSRKK